MSGGGATLTPASSTISFADLQMESWKYSALLLFVVTSVIYHFLCRLTNGVLEILCTSPFCCDLQWWPTPSPVRQQGWDLWPEEYIWQGLCQTKVLWRVLRSNRKGTSAAVKGGHMLQLLLPCLYSPQPSPVLPLCNWIGICIYWLQCSNIPNVIQMGDLEHPKSFPLLGIHKSVVVEGGGWEQTVGHFHDSKEVVHLWLWATSTSTK